MPKRSGGCEKCRRRKVRCDELRPRCQRCTDYGVICPGYRPPAEKDLHFVDETTHITRKAGTANVFSRDPKQHGSHTQYRFRNQFSGEIVDSAPVAVNSTHLHRVQLLSTFLDLYLPKRRDPRMASHFTYISALPNVDLSTPLLQIAVDTLCLAELGSLYNDERCLQESRSRYVRALPMLGQELTKPSSRQAPKDIVLASITILAMCELFDAIAKGNRSGQGWISHVEGAQQYICSNGPEVIKSPFGWLLFLNIRHSSMCMGLVRRKAVVFAKPKWLHLTKEISKVDSYVALYDLVIQAPGLLERADNLGSSENFLDDFLEVCKVITRLRTELEEWQALHHREQPYEVLDILDMKEFAKLCPDRTFVTAFSFPNVQTCSQLQLFWIISLMMDFTVANLYRLYSKQYQLPDTSIFTTRSRAEFWADMYTCATNYCRSTPYCCEPETASAGRIGTFLLRIAQTFFEIAGHTKEIKWCFNVRKMLEQSTVRPPTSAPPRPTPKHQSTELEADVYVMHQTPKPQLRLEGQYPNKTYNPRRGVSSDYDEAKDTHHATHKKSSWPPSFGALPQAGLIALTGSLDAPQTTSMCSPLPFERPDLYLTGTRHDSYHGLDHIPTEATRDFQHEVDLKSTDLLLQQPQVVGLPSNRLRRDLSQQPRHARRWNVPLDIAQQASQILRDGPSENDDANGQFRAFQHAPLSMNHVPWGKDSDDVGPLADEQTFLNSAIPNIQHLSPGCDTTVPPQYMEDFIPNLDPQLCQEMQAQNTDERSLDFLMHDLEHYRHTADTTSLWQHWGPSMGGDDASPSQPSRDGEPDENTENTTAVPADFHDLFAGTSELENLRLMPDGEPRTGPIGSMCF